LALLISDSSSYSINSSIDATLQNFQQEFGLGPDDGDETVACGDQSQSTHLHFTAAENPFLFPDGLLSALVHPRWSGNSFRDERAINRPGAVSATDVGLADDSVAPCPRWWLAHAKPRQEKKLAEQLRSRNVPHYLPVTKCTAVTRGRTRLTRSPLFSGYLFLWMDSAQRRAALETNRIVATHRVGNQEALSGQLWNLADLIEKGVPLRVEERLAAGQHVRVKSGILKDKQGTIIKRGGKTRLFVFVNELLGGVSVEIEQHLLEPY
jgi:transcriptional antiterminator RfaH